MKLLLLLLTVMSFSALAQSEICLEARQQLSASIVYEKEAQSQWVQSFLSCHDRACLKAFRERYEQALVQLRAAGRARNLCFHDRHGEVSAEAPSSL